MKSVHFISLLLFCVVGIISCDMDSNCQSEIAIPNRSLLTMNKLCHFCINNDFPTSSFKINDECGWKPCFSEPEQTITSLEGAYLWAAYNPYWYDDLLFKACGQSIPDTLPMIEGFIKIDDFRHPKMKWNFMWAHYYVIERKFNDGGWQIIYTYSVPTQMTPQTPPPDTSFTDTSVHLPTFEGGVCYRIYAKVWSILSCDAPMIYWGVPKIESLEK